MIAIVSGLPGSGKTLNGIRQFLLSALKKGRQVHTNIEGLNVLRISIYLDIPYIDAEKLIVFHAELTTKTMIGLPTGCLAIIDEAQIPWNNRAYSSQENLTLLPWLQKSRHYGIDCIFLTQNIDQLDVGIRRLAHVHYRLSKLTNAGLSKTVKVKIYPDAMGSEQFAPMSTAIWRIDPNMYPLYDSYINGSVSEAKPFVGNIIFKNPKLIFAVVCLIITAILSYNGIVQKKGSIFDGSDVVRNYKLPDTWSQYYCGEGRLYVQHKNEKIDTIPSTRVPQGICPKIGHLEVNL